MTVYCVDTSSLIAAWQERYPIENFPKFWEKIEQLIIKERLISPIDVLNEIQKRSDELHKWLKVHSAMFIELDDAIQIEAADVLSRFPRLVGEKKLRTSADPFVISLARVKGLQIVTEEKPTGNSNKPNIPDVCLGLGMKAPFSLLELIKADRLMEDDRSEGAADGRAFGGLSARPVPERMPALRPVDRAWRTSCLFSSRLMRAESARMNRRSETPLWRRMRIFLSAGMLERMAQSDCAKSVAARKSEAKERMKRLHHTKGAKTIYPVPIGFGEGG
jgi:hypothetical protein